MTTKSIKRMGWAVITDQGRMRNHLYLTKRAAKNDSLPEWGDKLVRVEIRTTSEEGKTT